MAVTGTSTVGDICNQALWKSGIVSNGSAATAEEFARATDDLNSMLKAWQAKGYHLWTVTSQSLTLTTAASYTLDPIRPLKILSARIKKNGTETPMTSMTRDEYDMLPVKLSTGFPTQYYYDRQREAALFYVWPVLAAASGETVEMSFNREQEDITPDTLADAIDIPAEWYEAVVYNLASRLGDTFELNIPKIDAKAVTFLDDALSFDSEESVYFCGD